MSENEACFVEWMEEFVSQERGSRVVHYLLKDSEGNSVLAVVGTERSLRHMVYVVADEFLTYSGTDTDTDNPIQSGFKWRSRREVVDWLTSMIAKHEQSEYPGVSTRSFGSSAQHFSVADKMDRVRNVKSSHSDIVWLGASWTCGKQLKHFPAFIRNGTTISAQSFVFVMAKEENRYVAYLEDMYEDKKGQKKVKVRWFHHSQEVKGVVRLRNCHPKEVYITPYTQVISVECVDGPAIVLTREHFEKCIGSFPDGLLGKVHICFRQFRSNKIKPFDLSKLKGYVDQPLISCLDSDTFLDLHSGKQIKRSRDHESFLTSDNGVEGIQPKKVMCASVFRSGYSGMYDKKTLPSRNLDSRRWHSQLFKVHDKIELLCQDSGIRGCWFRCTILEISRKQIKLEYSDLEDQDGCGKVEEWVPAFRLAAADKLGMRCLERPAIRPCSPITDAVGAKFEVGDPVDAWWSDGWWEGVVTVVNNDEDGNLQVYAPGENLFLNISRENLRISRDWVNGKWIDVKPKRDILAVISPTSDPPTSSTVDKDEEADNSTPMTKTDENDDKEVDLPTSSTVRKDEEADNSTPKTKIDGNDDKEVDLPTPASPAVSPEKISSLDKDDLDDRQVDQKSDDVSVQDKFIDVGMSEGGEKADRLSPKVVGSCVPCEDDSEMNVKLGEEVTKIVTATEEGISGEEKEAQNCGSGQVKSSTV